jgi:hypothetical protein
VRMWPEMGGRDPGLIYHNLRELAESFGKGPGVLMALASRTNTGAGCPGVFNKVSCVRFLATTQACMQIEP